MSKCKRVHPGPVPDVELKDVVKAIDGIVKNTENDADVFNFGEFYNKSKRENKLTAKVCC